ncbi:MAG: DUF58 domain-containing protein [Sedimentisphaerales bacterium]|nr:DUF58 domain-containing protein [Sedimentisphaerales bacterium]
MRDNHEKLCFGLTEAGRVTVRGTLFVAMAALIVPAFGVLGILGSVMLTALLVGFIVRPRVRIEGNLPDRVVAGRIASLTYTLQNVGRLPAYNLWVGFGAPPQTIEQVAGERTVSRLRPGETTRVTVTIRPTRRGRYLMSHPICRSAFPFNLFWFGTSRKGQEKLTVLPPFSRVHMPVWRLGRHAETVGVRLAGRSGVSPEYIGSRPYKPGDPPRYIDARAWARLASPATKEYDEDCDNHAAVVLDTRIVQTPRHVKSGQIDELEAAVSLCASVAFTMNSSHFIEVLLAGTELHEFTGWPREARLDRIHDLLAGVEASQAQPDERTILALADRFEEMSQVVFILLSWGSTSEQLVELAQRAGCYCTVVLIGGPNGRRTGAEPVPLWSGTVRVLPAQEVLAGGVKAL